MKLVEVWLENYDDNDGHIARVTPDEIAKGEIRMITICASNPPRPDPIPDSITTYLATDRTWNGFPVFKQTSWPTAHELDCPIWDGGDCRCPMGNL